MTLSTRERNVLIVAALVAVVFMVSTLLPQLRQFHQQRNEALLDLEMQIERERRLVQESVQWRDRRIEAENMESQLESLLFSGNTVPVIEADIQRAMTQHARDSGISVTSTRLAERRQSAGWLLISQEMEFRTQDAANTVRFLERLDASAPRLWVTDFSIDRSRSNYSGSVTVVGFARSDGMQLSGNAGR